jgi:hypothetical protein
MPIVPQYRAEGPANPVSPALESVQRERVDASTALRGLANLSSAVDDAAAPIPNAPQDLGQATMRGLSAVGAGVKDVGKAVFDVQERIARAWNFTKLSEAQDVMDAAVADFQKFKLSEPDPTKWGTEWSNRFEKVRGQLLSGDLSPAAKEEINQRVVTFGTRFGLNVDLDAQKEIIGRARDASVAELWRAAKAGDLVGAQAIVDTVVAEGWEGEDWAVRTMWDIEDKVRGDNIESARMQAETAAIRGDYVLGRSIIEQTQWETPEERDNELAKYDAREGAISLGNSINTRLQDGEDPTAVLAEMQAKDADGNFLHHQNLPPSARSELIGDLYKQVLTERDARVAGADEGIAANTIKNEEQLMAQLEGTGADETTVALLRKKLNKERVNTEEEIVSLQLKVSNYNPVNDPDGVAYISIRRQVEIVLGGEARPPLLGTDPRRDKIITMLDRLRSGERLTPGEEVKKQALASVRDMVEAGGAWQIPSERIKEMPLEDGTTVFVDTGADIKPDAEGYFEEKPGMIKKAAYAVTPFYSPKKGRIVTLNQVHKEAVRAGKSILVEDINARSRTLGEASPHIDEIERKLETGEIKDTGEALEVLNTRLTPMALDAAGRVVDGVSGNLMPPAMNDEAQQNPKGVDMSEEAKNRWMEAGINF